MQWRPYLEPEAGRLKPVAQSALRESSRTAPSRRPSEREMDLRRGPSAWQAVPVSPRVSTFVAGLLLMAAFLTGPRAIDPDARSRVHLVRSDVVAAYELSRSDNSPEHEVICDSLRSGSDVPASFEGPAGTELAMRLTQLYALDD
jgi:hypothetical protein